MTRHAIPTCPDCGASLPHDNPMAKQFHQMQVQKQREKQQQDKGQQVTPQEKKLR